MIDYLIEYNIDIAKMKKVFNKDIINNFDLMSDNVRAILDYLKSLGIDDFNAFIFVRPDICFMEEKLLEEKVKLFASDFIKFVFENDPGNLINLDI